MGKESLTSKAKERQEPTESILKEINESLKKSQKENTQKLNAELKKISKLDFEDFKKAMIAQLKLIEKRINESNSLIVECTTNIIEWTAANRDAGLKTIAEKLHERDDLFCKAFEIRDERLENLEHLAMMQGVKLMSHIEDGSLSLEKKKSLCEYLGYDWDKTIENFSL